MFIESGGDRPIILQGDEIEVQSGGVIEVDMAIFRVKHLNIHQAAIVHANAKVGDASCTVLATGAGLGSRIR